VNLCILNPVLYKCGTYVLSLPFFICPTPENCSQGTFGIDIQLEKRCRALLQQTTRSHRVKTRVPPNQESVTPGLGSLNNRESSGEVPVSLVEEKLGQEKIAQGCIQVLLQLGPQPHSLLACISV